MPETGELSASLQIANVEFMKTLWMIRCDAVKAMTKLACCCSNEIDPKDAFACAHALEIDINRLLHNKFEV